MNQIEGERIGSSHENVEEVDVDDEGIGWGHCLRVKVRMDLRKSIARGRTTMIKGMEYWILLKYEKLPKVYFMCGCIIHNTQACKQQNNSGTQGDQYSS